MKFLVDEDLPRSTAALIRQFGYEAEDVRDVGLRGASDDRIAAYAKQKELCVVTGDIGFADIRKYPPNQYGGLVVLEIPRDGTAKMILSLLASFLAHSEIISDLKGKLAVVEFGRVRLRSS